MQLSRFFTLKEMTRSDTASRLGIANLPDEPALASLKALCAAILDPLREGTGAAINVSSGYRGPELNARIGGAKKSQHMEGKAADIQSHGMDVLELFKAVIRLKLPFDQVIYEAKNRTSKWVHVSHDPDRLGGNRGAILLADFGNDGKVLRYRTITAQEAVALPGMTTRSGAPEIFEFEEVADEPDSIEIFKAAEAQRDEAPPTPRAVKPRKARPKKKAGARRKPARETNRAQAKKAQATKAKPREAKAFARRKTAAKRSRPKAKKHK